ncbi:islet amyloid polypeptide isoform X1 [Sceloporus undulatus]|uniref:islet amyloid polypeptide isoform X1 n=2 Tax=Sceloporus undulatus TaxID=8520 RepID=UPI001C4C0BF8|nr:islet amyloid polypeptide isoform X1 [Sceloporus undulatus]
MTSLVILFLSGDSSKMCSLKGPFLFMILCITLNSLEATPVERLLSLADDLSDGTPDRQEWFLPIVSRSTGFLGINGALLGEEVLKPKSHRLEKRRCNTATCVTQRLADFLVRSSNTIGAIYSPTNVGSNTYGKRDKEPPNYLQL